jgi:hypothetical protein
MGAHMISTDSGIVFNRPANRNDFEQASDDVLQALVLKFMNTRAKGCKDSKIDTFEEETSTTNKNASRTIPFIKICGELQLDPLHPTTTAKLDMYINGGLLKRTKLGRLECKALTAAKMPEASLYEYELIEKLHETSNRKSDKSSYKTQTELDATDAQHAEIRRNMFQKMGTKMMGRLANHEPEKIADAKPKPKRTTL